MASFLLSLIQSNKYKLDRIKSVPKTKSSLVSSLQNRIPIIRWLPSYTRTDAICDVIAGITIGLTLMPQSIAYAGLAELPTQYGLYSAFMGSFVYVFLGTIKEVSIGPTSLMALLCLAYTRDLPVDYTILLGFLAGCVELLMGILKLGFIVEFISTPVTAGFTSAMSLIITCTQLKGLLGLKFKTLDFFSNFKNIIVRIPEIRPADAGLGLCCCLFLLTFRKLKDINVKNAAVKKTLWYLSTSRNAILVLITSVIAYKFEEATGTTPFKISGKVAEGFPRVQLPPFSTYYNNRTVPFVEMVSTLGSGIIVLPFVAVLGNVAIAKAFASGEIVDATQEMMTLGVCNILGSFVQGMPTCGAFTRSAVSNASGVRSPMAGLYSGSLIVLALTFLTEYFYFIPKATLSSILICAVIFMFNYEIILPLWRSSKFDLLIYAITFFLSLNYGVEVGLLVGAIVNALGLLKLWTRPKIFVKTCMHNPDSPYILIKPQLGLYYSGADHLRQEIVRIAVTIGESKTPIVIDFSNVLKIDYSSSKAIDNLLKTFKKKRQQLVIININKSVYKQFNSYVDMNNVKIYSNENEVFDKLFSSEKYDCDSEQSPLLMVKDDTKELAMDNNSRHEMIIISSNRKRSLYDNNEANDDCVCENCKSPIHNV